MSQQTGLDSVGVPIGVYSTEIPLVLMTFGNLIHLCVEFSRRKNL